MVEVELRREQVWRSERESGAWLALGWAPGSHWSSIPPLHSHSRATAAIHTHSLSLTLPGPHLLGLYRVRGRCDSRQHCSSSDKLLAYFLNSFVAVLLGSELPELPPLDPIDH